MLTLPRGYIISGNQVIEKRTGAVVPRLSFDSSDKVFILENENGARARNITQAKLEGHLETYERSRDRGKKLAAPAQTDPSAKARQKVENFTKFLEETKEQLAKSKETLVSSVSSKTLTDELKTTVTESINAVYDQLIAIIDAKIAEIESATDVSQQAKLIRDDSNWQQHTKNKIKVLEEKFKSLVSTLNHPTKRLSTMGQVESAFTKLKESLISLLPSASKDGFNSNPLEALDTVLQSLDAQQATSNSESVELTHEEKDTLLNPQEDHFQNLKFWELVANLMNRPRTQNLKELERNLEQRLAPFNGGDPKIQIPLTNYYPAVVEFINYWGGIKPESRPKAEAIERFLKEQGFIDQGFRYQRSKKS